MVVIGYRKRQDNKKDIVCWACQLGNHFRNIPIYTKVLTSIILTIRFMAFWNKIELNINWYWPWCCTETHFANVEFLQKSKKYWDTHICLTLFVSVQLEEIKTSLSIPWLGRNNRTENFFSYQQKLISIISFAFVSMYEWYEWLNFTTPLIAEM